VAGLSYINVAPSAARLTESLRDIGYEFPTAVADIVDNCVAAGATRVEVEVRFDGSDSWVSIADDGVGMSVHGLAEALRYGSRREYGRGDLGRYGLGLKTASFSQCRSVTVVSQARGSGRTAARTMDLDTVVEWDDWVVISPGADEHVSRARELISGTGGTVVVWRKLDRVLPEKRPEGGWARRRIESMAARAAEHLGMVFHRFIEGDTGEPLVITVNGVKVEPWNPFAPDEPATATLPVQRFEISVGECTGTVGLRCYVLPSRDRFSSPTEFDRLSGPSNWNRQQGLYIYRAGRLVQWGGWGGIRGIDEHTKLARAAVEFDADLDLAFNINVAKMRVTIPYQLRQLLERPINELCIRAEASYRKTARLTDAAPAPAVGQPTRQAQRNGNAEAAAASTVGLALRSAAMHAGEYDAWLRITDVLRAHAPEVAASLGLDG
jgi:hypothetical protein